MNVPGQVIPRDPAVRAAIATGERLFGEIGCAGCHVPALPLTRKNNPGAPGKPGWIYTEPSPYNPTTGPNSPQLDPGPDALSGKRAAAARGPDQQSTAAAPSQALGRDPGVPAYTDLKLHNLCDGPTDANAEALDQNQPAGSAGFFAGNQSFLTRKLWGLYNQGPFGHSGKFTTMREAINLGHNGEATTARVGFQRLPAAGQDAVIEFLKSLQVLPPGTRCRVVDERYDCREDEREQADSRR